MNDITTDPSLTEPYAEFTERQLWEIYEGAKRAYDYWWPDATPAERDAYLRALTDELEI